MRSCFQVCLNFHCWCLLEHSVNSWSGLKTLNPDSQVIVCQAILDEKSSATGIPPLSSGIFW